MTERSTVGVKIQLVSENSIQIASGFFYVYSDSPVKENWMNKFCSKKRIQSQQLDVKDEI